LQASYQGSDAENEGRHDRYRNLGVPAYRTREGCSH
jgi:hypothetical protein